MTASDDHKRAIDRIRKCKDYYEILQIGKDFSESEIKKQYRRLALLLHPDKNSEPGAAEAFKAVGNAFAVLSDADKRRKYDVYGEDGLNGGDVANQAHHRHRAGASHYYNDYSRGFESDITPEEIFNMFFNGGFSTGSFTNRRWQATTHSYRTRDSRHYTNADGRAQEEVSPGFNLLVQLMPVLVLVSLSAASYWLQSDPPYSLHSTSKYHYPRQIQPYGIRYYVKDKFDTEYTGNSLRRLETQVVEDYTHELRNKCFRERNYRESMINRAHFVLYDNARALEDARNLKTPSCSEYEKLRGHLKYSIYV